MKRYCLANYILTIDIPSDIGFGSQSISIGGEGSYLDSISIKANTELFKLDADSTGSWVYTKNLDRSGEIEVSIKQVSDKVAVFKALMNIYINLSSEASGLTMTLRDSLNNTIAVCEDCLLNKIPDQTFKDSPDSQSWSFLSGKITFIDAA